MLVAQIRQSVLGVRKSFLEVGEKKSKMMFMLFYALPVYAAIDVGEFSAELIRCYTKFPQYLEKVV